MIHCPIFMALGSGSKARQEGKLRLERDEYFIRDANIPNIGFAS